MEAIVLSLKDLEMRRPESQTEKQPASDGPDSSKSPKKDDLPEATASMEHHDLLKIESTSTSVEVEQCVPSKAESTSTSVSKTHVSELKNQTPDSREPSIAPLSDASRSSKESRSAGPNTDNATSSSTQSTSETDLSANTKATLTVERNPTSNDDS